MTLFRVAPLAVLAILSFAPQGRAQLGTGQYSTGSYTTGQFGPGAFGAPAPAQPPQQPPCMSEFVPLRAETEKRGLAIKTAAQKKAPREQLCQLFRHFTESEAKVVKFLSEHQAACGIPAEAVKASKTSHARTMTMQQKICAADGVEGAKPRGPGLGEALGVRAIPTPETTKTGKGIFDTLSGSQLAQ